MEQTLNLNHNSAECIKSAARLTGTFYQNICNGQTSFVPYGVWDYVIGGSFIAFLIAFTLFMFVFLYMSISGRL